LLCHHFAARCRYRKTLLEEATTMIANFLRYPGSKRRMLSFLGQYLPSGETIKGRYIEPFVGGGAVFLYQKPRAATLSDINQELIDLYRGIRLDPNGVWKIYSGFGRTKREYWRVRKMNTPRLLVERAARTLYLNRTCFKGMWRHNRDGQFNVGYGGQSRRWVIDRQTLNKVAHALRHAKLLSSDFEIIIDEANEGDFLFLDPPYRPGERELRNDHYAYRKFIFNDHLRLAAALQRANHRKVSWAMTTSAHRDIVRLFPHQTIVPMPFGTGPQPGTLLRNPREILILNYRLKGE